jgi:hypothetical protein
MKTIIKLLAVILAVALVLIETYLIISSIIDKNNENNQIQSFCAIKCDYNPSSLLWEFSGDTATRGFTTRDECFSYCSKVKQGFAFNFIQKYNTASIINAVKKIFGR